MIVSNLSRLQFILVNRKKRLKIERKDWRWMRASTSRCKRASVTTQTWALRRTISWGSPSCPWSSSSPRSGTRWSFRRSAQISPPSSQGQTELRRGNNLRRSLIFQVKYFVPQSGAGRRDLYSVLHCWYNIHFDIQHLSTYTGCPQKLGSVFQSLWML